MGRMQIIYLDGVGIYSCARCDTHLARHWDFLSKVFNIYDDMNQRHLLEELGGPTYLIKLNVVYGTEQDQILITGRHTICDLRCKQCNAMLGWKYVKAFEEDQKYKEGRFILEKARITRQKQL